jgi:hypothetical protein
MDPVPQLDHRGRVALNRLIDFGVCDPGIGLCLRDRHDGA